MTISIGTLFSSATAASILATGLEIAQALGLPVTSWRVDDSARALIKFAAEVLGDRETLAEVVIKGGFLSSAEDDWLTLLADEVYDVQRTEASYATSTITLNNGGGGYYEFSAGDLAVKSSLTDKTYQSSNATIVTLAAGESKTISVTADEAGSDSAAGTDEIDTLVTTVPGVTITASTVATASDKQSDASLRIQCRATLGALSPNGPPDAYEYVARNSDLTGVDDVTRAKALENTSDGTVVVYVASSSGAVAGASVTAVQTALELWAEPLCIQATATNSSAHTIDVTATVSGGGVPATLSADVSAALATLFSEIEIGGTVALSALYATIHGYLVAQGVTSPTVTITAPTGDTALAAGEVPTNGTIDVTEV
jgi:phage-related baseplate assembly protein